jgi:DNA-binding IclR family transcriptional regulator
MPRRSAQPSVADDDAAPGGAAAVDRAISLLAAFRAGDTALSVSELALRTRLYKSTVLRLLASLAHGQLVRRTDDGQWALGPETARLAGLYAASFSLESEVLPEMRRLVADTGESVAFHVRQGEHRLVLFRIDSPQLLRDHARAGDLLPLDRGAGGRVLTAWSGGQGPVYDRIRQQGHVVVHGDRVAGLSGVSAPVWNAAGDLVGALTLTAPEQRMQPAFVTALCASAARLTVRLGGQPTGARASGRSTGR